VRDKIKIQGCLADGPCQQIPEAVFFYISDSRASQVLVDILGIDYCGISFAIISLRTRNLSS